MGTAEEIAEHAKVISNFKEKGAQLFPDLLSYAQDGFKGRKWFLDDRVTDTQVFKDTIFDALEKNKAIRSELKDVLSRNNSPMLDRGLDDWIADLKDNFDEFVEVVPSELKVN